MPILFALLAAVAAVLSYRWLEEWSERSWLPASCRAVAWGAVVLLVLNPSSPAVRSAKRPVVLLDASLSMQAAGGRWSEALALARQIGEVRPVGVPVGDTTASGGRSRLAAAVAAARSGGRPVVVVTDGEIEDADAIPADVLAGVAIRVLGRRGVPDLALTRVEGRARLTPSDSLVLDVEAAAVGWPGPTALDIDVREGARIWLRGVIRFDKAGQGRATLRGPLPGVAPGTHVLTLAIAQPADSEPRDDARLLVITIVPTPGVILLASPPTWESRFLLEALQDVAALPVRGYLETERGRWRQAGKLKPVTTREVSDAARRADVLVTLGNPSEPARSVRARGRMMWPATAPRIGVTADWYLSVPAATPVSGAFFGVAVDSFPPGTAVSELLAGPHDWIGLTAQAGRRGAVRPVLLGNDSAGIRRVVVGVDGLWRWAFRGGSSEQGYRALIAATVSWLLGGADSVAGRARLRNQVVQRGRPVIFEWVGAAPASATPINLEGSGSIRRDTLVFDGAGRAELLLPPGTWRYRLGGGGEGIIAVEEYSDEWLPGARTLAAREAGAAAAPERVPLRTWLWLFGICVLAFAGEWFARRKLGLR
jgi:hypothetical protein